MNIADIVILDALEIDAASGVPLAKASQPATGDDDVESFGDIPMMQALGLSSAPYPKDANGACEAAILKSIGGRDAVCVGARDTRTASIVGNLKPGDTVLHSTGPQQAAQLQLKEEKRQSVLVTKGTDGKQIMFSLDGKNDKVTIAAFGGVFEMTKDSLSMLHPSGSSGIVISADGVQVIGKLMTGSTPIPGLSIAMGSPAAMTAAGLVPCLSIAGSG